MPSQIEDKIAIEDLIATYNQSLDYGHYDAWLDCWTEDAVFDGLGKYLVGRAQIKGFSDAYEGTVRSRLHALKHYTINILSTIDGDSATSTSYLQLVHTTVDGVAIRFTGRYEDKLKRIAGQWKFAGRKMTQDMPPPGAAARQQ